MELGIKYDEVRHGESRGGGHPTGAHRPGAIYVAGVEPVRDRLLLVMRYLWRTIRMAAIAPISPVLPMIVVARGSQGYERNLALSFAVSALSLAISASIFR